MENCQGVKQLGKQGKHTHRRQHENKQARQTNVAHVDKNHANNQRASWKPLKTGKQMRQSRSLGFLTPCDQQRVEAEIRSEFLVIKADPAERGKKGTPLSFDPPFSKIHAFSLLRGTVSDHSDPRTLLTYLAMTGPCFLFAIPFFCWIPHEILVISH